jgi:hypothetical protein
MGPITAPMWKAQHERVLASLSLHPRSHLQQFLRFVVDETLAAVCTTQVDHQGSDLMVLNGIR